MTRGVGGDDCTRGLWIESLRRPRKLWQRQQVLRGPVDCFVEGGEEGMRLQAVLSFDDEDNGGVLAGSPPTALHMVRGAVHVDCSANPISPGGTGTTCKAAQPRL